MTSTYYSRMVLPKNYLIFLQLLLIVLFFFNVDRTRLTVDMTFWRFCIDQERYLDDNLIIEYFNGTTNCSHCNYTVRNENANSTPRDLILAGSTTNVKNINLFIRTLRHTGSKCTVAFLLDSAAYNILTPEMLKDIYQCGGQVINMGTPEFTGDRDYFSLVYLWVLYVAKRNSHRFDRIYKCDLFDTYFQGDPFDNLMEPNNFYMIEERPPDHNPFKFYFNISHKLNLSVSQNDIMTYACAGIAFGYTEDFVRALMIYYSIFYFGSHWDDQHVFNVMKMYGLLGFHHKYQTPNPNFTLMRPIEPLRHLWSIRMDGNIGEITSIYNKTIYATIVHHTHVAPQLQNSVNISCPNHNKNIINYI